MATRTASLPVEDMLPSCERLIQRLNRDIAEGTLTYAIKMKEPSPTAAGDTPDIEVMLSDLCVKILSVIPDSRLKSGAFTGLQDLANSLERLVRMYEVECFREGTTSRIALVLPLAHDLGVLKYRSDEQGHLPPDEREYIPVLNVKNGGKGPRTATCFAVHFLEYLRMSPYTREFPSLCLLKLEERNLVKGIPGSNKIWDIVQPFLDIVYEFNEFLTRSHLSGDLNEKLKVLSEIFGGQYPVRVLEPGTTTLDGETLAKTMRDKVLPAILGASFLSPDKEFAARFLQNFINVFVEQRRSEHSQGLSRRLEETNEALKDDGKVAGWLTGMAKEDMKKLVELTKLELKAVKLENRNVVTSLVEFYRQENHGDGRASIPVAFLAHLLANKSFLADMPDHDGSADTPMSVEQTLKLLARLIPEDSVRIEKTEEFLTFNGALKLLLSTSIARTFDDDYIRNIASYLQSVKEGYDAAMVHIRKYHLTKIESSKRASGVFEEHCNRKVEIAIEKRCRKTTNAVKQLTLENQKLKQETNDLLKKSEAQDTELSLECKISEETQALLKSQVDSLRAQVDSLRAQVDATEPLLCLKKQQIEARLRREYHDELSALQANVTSLTDTLTNERKKANHLKMTSSNVILKLKKVNRRMQYTLNHDKLATKKARWFLIQRNRLKAFLQRSDPVPHGLLDRNTINFGFDKKFWNLKPGEAIAPGMPIIYTGQYVSSVPKNRIVRLILDTFKDYNEAMAHNNASAEEGAGIMAEFLRAKIVQVTKNQTANQYLSSQHIRYLQDTTVVAEAPVVADTPTGNGTAVSSPSGDESDGSTSDGSMQNPF